jgi:hypothetical protein
MEAASPERNSFGGRCAHATSASRTAALRLDLIREAYDKANDKE